MLEYPEIYSSLSLLITACALRLVFFAKRDKKVDNCPIFGQAGDPSFQGALTKGYTQVRS